MKYTYGTKYLMDKMNEELRKKDIEQNVIVPH